MQGKSWYFSRKGRVEGPFTKEQLEGKARQNKEILVWNPSLSEWQKAEKVFNIQSDPVVRHIRSGQSQSTFKAANSDIETAHTNNFNNAIESIQSNSLNMTVAKAAASQSLKGFAERWLKLEDRHSHEKKQLLLDIIRQQDISVDEAKSYLQSLKKTTSQNPKSEIKLASVSGEPVNHTESEPDYLSKFDKHSDPNAVSLAKVKELRARLLAVKSGQPRSEVDLETGDETEYPEITGETKRHKQSFGMHEKKTATIGLTEPQSNVAEKSSSDRHEESNSVVAQPDDHHPHSDEDAMMRRVMRRRRRRAR